MNRIQFHAVLCLAFFVFSLLAGCGVPPGEFVVDDSQDYVTAAFEPKDLGRKPTQAEADAVKAVIESRLDSQRILNREVTVDAQNGQVFVRFPLEVDEADPSAFDYEKMIEELGSTARLTFRDPDGTVVLEGSQVASVTPNINRNTVPIGYYVDLELKPDGVEAFAEATGRLIGQTIAIYMDEEEISAPTVQSQITDGQCQITGLESYESAKTLAGRINSGALPYALSVVEWNVAQPD